MFKALIFDFDGVMVLSEPLHYLAFAETLQPYKVSFGEECYKQNYLPYTDRETFVRVFQDNNIVTSEVEINKLIAAKRNIYRRFWSEKLSLCPGVLKLMDEAKELAIPVAICSGSCRADIEKVLTRAASPAILNSFKFIVTSDVVVNPKPHPEGYLLAAEKVGVAPHDCLAIEDSPVGILAAKRAGLNVFGVTTSYSQDKLALADRVVDSLEEISLKVRHFSE